MLTHKIKKLETKINTQLDDERLKEKLYEHIYFMIENNCQITQKQECTILNTKIGDKQYDLIISILDTIKYTYTEQNYTESVIYDTKEKISQYSEIRTYKTIKTIKNIISQFNQDGIEIINNTYEKQIERKIENPIKIEKKTEYIKINDKIFYIEATNNKTKYGILIRPLNDKYIPVGAIYIKINHEQYKKMISEEQEKILVKKH